jgi:hypothetical protein
MIGCARRGAVQRADGDPPVDVLGLPGQFLSHYRASTPFHSETVAAGLPLLTKREFMALVARHCRLLTGGRRITLFRNGETRVVAAETLRRLDCADDLADHQFSTVQLFHLHQIDRALRQAALSLAGFFHEVVGVNGYYSSPQATQGLKPHVDGHDVIVTQCHGERRWEIDAERCVSARDRQERVAAFVGSPGKLVVVLRPGDVLYIPRGFAHRTGLADSRAESLHLSFGIYRRNGRSLVSWLEECLHRTAQDGALGFQGLAKALRALVAEDGWQQRFVARLEEEQGQSPLLVEENRAFLRSFNNQNAVARSLRT